MDLDLRVSFDRSSPEGFAPGVACIGGAPIANPLGSKKVVFLIGAQRSGTTWLQLLLSRSPLVATAPETHLFSVAMRSLFSSWNINARATGLHHLFAESEYRDMLRQVAISVLTKVADRKPSATVILEKTPDHILFWRDILSVFPEAHFIHIVRDPRAVVASMLAVAHGWGPRWALGEIFAATDRWTAFVAAGRQIKSATPRYYEIAYEELVASGSYHLERLFKWLCVDVTPGECERYLEDCRIDRLQEGELDGMEIAIGQRRREFFRFGRSDQWKRELSSWEVAAIERRAQPLLGELGFACSNRHSAATSTRVALYALKMVIQAGIKVRLEAAMKHL